MLSGIQLRFHPKETAYPECWEGYEPATKARPDPGFCTPGNTQHDNANYHYRHYRWYYADNLGQGCCFIAPRSACLGYHPHDLEGITVLFDGGAEAPQKVYFHAHSNGQGMWRDWAKCEKTVEGHLVVYVARNSHAAYPAAQTYWRALGLANDVTSAQGRHVTYTNFEVPPLVIRLSSASKGSLASTSCRPSTSKRSNLGAAQSEPARWQARVMDLEATLPGRSASGALRLFLPCTKKAIASL